MTQDATLMCVWIGEKYWPIYLKKKLPTYQYFSFESVQGEAILKMGWMVKKYSFCFSTASYCSKSNLMVGLYIWLSIYTNTETFHIIWKFNLSPWGVLGRIYVLSIEVLYAWAQSGKILASALVFHNYIDPFPRTFSLTESMRKAVVDSWFLWFQSKVPLRRRRGLSPWPQPQWSWTQEWIVWTGEHSCLWQRRRLNLNHQ